MIDLHDVQAAQERIRGKVNRTPLLRVQALDNILGCRAYLKHEGFQRTGSFKARGAVNAISCLSPEERGRGVVACSSGNHAQGVAYAAKELGIDALIVMPTNVNPIKMAGVQALGGRTLLYGTLSSERAAEAERLCREEGRVMIHPYANDYVRAGQGTIGLEIIEDEPELDAVVVPVGGGGLITGVATAVKGLSPQIRVIGVEPAGAARYSRSRAEGRPVALEQVNTIADGTRSDQAEPENFLAIERLVDHLVAVEDDYIRQAMVLAISVAHLVAEPSSVMGLAAALSQNLPVKKEDKVCFVLSGGNNDLGFLARVLAEA